MEKKNYVSAKLVAASLAVTGMLFTVSASLADEVNNSSVNRICACLEQGKDRNCNPLAATSTEPSGSRGDSGRHDSQRE